MEQWRVIDGYPNYEVSDTGKVKANTKKSSGKLLNPYMHSGYFAVTLRTPGAPKKIKDIHRLMAQAFIPNPESRPHVNHKDGDKLNNNVLNLEWCTPAENQIHAYKTGLRKPTKKWGHGIKLNDLQYRIIVKSRELPQQYLADVFGVTQRNISHIIKTYAI